MLGMISIVLNILIGIPLGITAATHRNTFRDQGLLVSAMVFISVPQFFLAQVLVVLFAVELGWLPPFGIDTWKCWILPVLSMSLGNTAYYAMWLRRYMVDESQKDYVMLARIKGADENRIMFRHVFRNSFVPLAQYIPTSFLNTVIGSIYIESLYSIPGMGGLLVDVIKKQDNAMIQGIVLLFACVGVIGLLLGDIMMVILDPRINFSKKGGDR